jgi:hypothetical protein
MKKEDHTNILSRDVSANEGSDSKEGNDRAAFRRSLKKNGKEIEENTRHNINPAMSLQTRTSEGRSTGGRPRKHDNQRTRSVSDRDHSSC